jgi:hypothetical protein
MSSVIAAIVNSEDLPMIAGFLETEGDEMKLHE